MEYKNICICVISFIILLYFTFNVKYIYTLEQLQIIHIELIEIFKKLKKVLNKHNIKYWAIGGTLLGTIRDNKIIPWDDDMDLGILKDEFLMLKENEDSKS